MQGSNTDTHINVYYANPYNSIQFSFAKLDILMLCILLRTSELCVGALNSNIYFAVLVTQRGTNLHTAHKMKMTSYYI